MSASSESIDDLLLKLSPLARHFAGLMEKLAGGNKAELRLAAALVSHFTTEHGHVCIDLTAIREQLTDIDAAFELPEPKAWVSNLRATVVVGVAGEFKPLILDPKGRLFLHRYWVYEEKLANHIRVRSRATPFDANALREAVAQLFPTERESAHSSDWQKVAAVTAAMRQLTVISGGPGTGKTTTLVKTLALLTQQAWPQKLRIALAAPTGKAAARLQETISAGKKTLNCPAHINALVPETASTIHRLLGTRLGSDQPQYDAKNPLPFDVVVLDEASMIDLALMLKLFEAVPASARIILAGDKNQLASVEAGAVLGEISAGGANSFSEKFCADYLGVTDESLTPAPAIGPVTDSVIELRQNFRFENIEIGNLTDAVNRGDASAINEMFATPSELISYQPFPKGISFDSLLKRIVLENWRSYFEANDVREALRAFNQFRILTPLRYGSFGVSRLNERVEQILGETHLIRRNSIWYRRRPVLITQNDYNLKLFNGDVGVTEEVQRGKFQVLFPGPEESTNSFFPARLPAHETVYTTTIHKSQGSEFDHVLLVLPEKSSVILNRELIYTALTRAKKKITIWADVNVFQTGVAQPSRRHSTLSDLLAAPAP